MQGVLTSKIMQDYSDKFGSVTVIERTDMTVETTQRLAQKYIDEAKIVHWVDQEIGKNAAGETLYVKVLTNEITKPSWVPTEIVSE